MAHKHFKPILLALIYALTIGVGAQIIINPTSNGSGGGGGGITPNDCDTDEYATGINASGVLTCDTVAAGSAAWGSITGTLSDQTDLQNALNLKANLTSIGNKLAWTIGNGSDAIPTGWQGCAVAEVAGTINSAILYNTATAASANTSIVLDVWKDTYANWPPTVADTITASSKPTLSSSNKESNALTGWTTTVTKGDTFCVNVDSNGGGATRVQLTLTY